MDGVKLSVPPNGKEKTSNAASKARNATAKVTTPRAQDRNPTNRRLVQRAVRVHSSADSPIAAPQAKQFTVQGY
jgi:hypothetical protein